MTSEEILQYIVEHRGGCPNNVRLCVICPLSHDNRSCIDNVFPDKEIPFEGLNAAYYRAAYSMLMDILIERALKEAECRNSAPQ